MAEGRPVHVNLVMATGAGTYTDVNRILVTAERGETSIVTRDNIERAVLDALAELMDRSGL